MFFVWDKNNAQDYGFFERREDAEYHIINTLMPYKKICGWDAYDGYEIRERDDSPHYMEARLLLDDGTWIRPVWHDHVWYRNRVEDIKAFAHVDPDKPENILYFESPAKARKGVTTSTKPGRFLKKYFSDILSDDQITEWADVHREQFLEVPELKWARTGEEIAAVYSMDAAFSSCMQHRLGVRGSGWPEDLTHHPTYAYGAGDLSVAYVCKGDRLLARALVWEEKNKVGRVYGDGALFRKCLKEYGIKTYSTQEEYDTFEGARLLILPYEGDDERYEARKSSNRVILPYVDGFIDGLNYNEDKTYFVLVDQEWDEWGDECSKPATFWAGNPDGISYSNVSCEKCGRYTAETFTVISENNERLCFCDNCIGDTHWSEYSSNRYDNRYFEEVSVLCSNEWGEYIKFGIVGVDPITQLSNGRYADNDNIITLYDGTIITLHEAKLSTFTSEIDSQQYRIKDRVVWDGKVMTLEQAKERGARFSALFGEETVVEWY